MHKYVRLVMIYEIVNVKHLHMHKYVRLVMIYESQCKTLTHA